MGIWLGIVVLDSDILQSVSIPHRLRNIGVSVALVLLCEWWFVRRMGITLDDRGLTLHYAFLRRRIPWSRIQGFMWKRWRSTRTEYLWIVTDGVPVRIPTVQRVTRGFSFFGSTDLRSPAGVVGDAIQMLETARAGHHKALDATPLAMPERHATEAWTQNHLQEG